MLDSQRERGRVYNAGGGWHARYVKRLQDCPWAASQRVRLFGLCGRPFGTLSIHGNFQWASLQSVYNPAQVLASVVATGHPVVLFGRPVWKPSTSDRSIVVRRPPTHGTHHPWIIGILVAIVQSYRLVCRSKQLKGCQYAQTAAKGPLPTAHGRPFGDCPISGTTLFFSTDKAHSQVQVKCRLSLE